jgi:hypothetical protein
MPGCVQNTILNAIGGTYIDHTNFFEDIHTRCELVNKRSWGNSILEKWKTRTHDYICK